MNELTIGQQLEEICVKHNLRMGQLICLIYQMTFKDEDLFYISNSDLIEQVKQKLSEYSIDKI